jgi:ribonucleoside-diphosphate reductase beta chain
VVQATQKEELIHAMFGVAVIKHIQNEYPEWFNEHFYDKIYRASQKAYDAECAIIDWIFEKGELSFLSKATLKEFIKQRFNDSLEMIGGKPIFVINKDEVKKLQWFNDEIYAEVSTDFFHKKPVSYAKKVKPITAGDLF